MVNPHLLKVEAEVTSLLDHLNPFHHTQKAQIGQTSQKTETPMTETPATKAAPPTQSPSFVLTVDSNSIVSVSGTANLVASGDADFSVTDINLGVVTPDKRLQTKASYVANYPGTQTIIAISRSGSKAQDRVIVTST